MLLCSFTVASLAVWMLGATLWAKPALYIIGDSTVRNSTGGQMGWGDPLVAQFDPAKIEVVNRAIGGRSSRTFLTEGRWDAVMAHLQPGDFVLIQFGHNDGGKVNDKRCRASIKGIGGASEEIVRQSDGKPETVHTYGWYLTKYIRDAKSKGAVPLLVSPIPRNLWKDGKLGRSEKDYGLWAKQTAEREGAPFIDLNGILTNCYGALGQEKTAELFAVGDHTHTGPKGAEFNAAVMAEAIRSLKDCYLAKGLLPGDLWLPSVFSDHMILQQDMPVPVWGKALPGAAVSVKLGDKSASTRADDTGRWRVDLPPLTEGGPFSLELRSNGAGRKVSDVMVGEVWLCVGHMGEGSPAPRGSNPRIRVFTAETTRREFPQREVAGKWTVSAPGTIYHFDPKLLQQTKSPLGIITAACGEGSLESWIRRETLEAHPQFEKMLKAYGHRMIAFRDKPAVFGAYGVQRSKWQSGLIPRSPDPVQDPRSPAVLHNGMIAPLIPYALRGAIWHHAELREANAEFQQILIHDWRKLWNLPKMRFDRVTRPSAQRRAGAHILNSPSNPVASTRVNS